MGQQGDKGKAKKHRGLQGLGNTSQCHYLAEAVSQHYYLPRNELVIGLFLGLQKLIRAT